MSEDSPLFFVLNELCEDDLHYVVEDVCNKYIFIKNLIVRNKLYQPILIYYLLFWVFQLLDSSPTK